MRPSYSSLCILSWLLTVSPEDLLNAARLGSTFHLATLPSRVLVLRRNELADPQVMASRILAAIEACRNGITALEAAAALRLSVPLSEQVLLAAEKQGVLCRDEGGADVRFWKCAQTRPKICCLDSHNQLLSSRAQKLFHELCIAEPFSFAPRNSVRALDPATEGIPAPRPRR